MNKKCNLYSRKTELNGDPPQEDSDIGTVECIITAL